MLVKRLLPALVCMFAAGSVARGALFWRTWEGAKYPEQELWQRYTRGGGAERTLSDGMLTLDGMASGAIVDEYYWNTQFILGPAQYLRLDWRLRVDEVAGYADPGVAVAAGDYGDVFLVYQENRLLSLSEGVWINFAPGVFHKYSLTSKDLVAYDLRIDGQLVRTGYFSPPSSQSLVAWGDTGEGSSSLSVWDYVRFGVVAGYSPGSEAHVWRLSNGIQLGNVPEPSTGLLVGSAGLPAIALSNLRRRRTVR